MPETTTAAKTTTPRKRAATPRTATRKPAATTTAKTATTESVAAGSVITRFKIELEFVDNTKSYAKFSVPDQYKGTMVGNVYAPLGTARVALLVVGSDDTDTED